MHKPVLCGASIWRCAECGHAVAGGYVRAGKSCPKHPSAEVQDSTCRRPALSGQSRCQHHGGGTPQARERGLVRVAEAKARLVVEAEGWDPVTDPLTALAELLGEMTAFKEQLGAMAGELVDLTVEDKLGRQDVVPTIAAYERSMDRLGRFLTDAARLDLQGRTVRLREAQAAAVIAALGRTLADPLIGLTPAQREMANDRLRRELVAADGDGA